jgi:nitroimidazol reductase NimA-like FMN-containing flavoprotein (pyridoxamine 5'-phosphate oxidase superfamily)
LDLNEKIETLLDSQKFAVLSTENDRQPYSNLIAFAEYSGCKEIIFFTPKNTRKYKNLIANNRVALMIDNRTNQSRDFNDVTAITLIGTAEELDAGNQQYLLDAFIAKHPNLADLTRKNENAFFKIKISDYIVASFNKSFRVQF